MRTSSHDVHDDDDVDIDCCAEVDDADDDGDDAARNAHVT